MTKTRDGVGKNCTKCGEYKTNDQFSKHAHTKDGLQSWCKRCHTKLTTAKNKIARTTKGRNATSAERVHYNYKVSRSEATRLRAITECQSCSAPVSHENRTQHIDHSYATGEVRGVLCPRCNTGIGKLGDSYEGVLQAAYYLVRSVDALALAETL